MAASLNVLINTLINTFLNMISYQENRGWRHMDLETTFLVSIIFAITVNYLCIIIYHFIG